MDNTVDPILAVAILVNILKPALARWATPASSQSDSLVRALALALGVAGELAAGWLTRSLSQATLSDDLGRGFSHGVLAILLYHLVASRGPEDAGEPNGPPGGATVPGAPVRLVEVPTTILLPAAGA